MTGIAKAIALLHGSLLATAHGSLPKHTKLSLDCIYGYSLKKHMPHPTINSGIAAIAGSCCLLYPGNKLRTCSLSGQCHFVKAHSFQLI
jgi:hypothetical protein